MPCQARITSLLQKLPFGDGKHYFYIENVCGNGCEGSICMKCSTKKEKALQTSRTFDHGLITEPYKEKSHMFDSPWYHKHLKMYGEPLEENLIKARAAQEKAKKGTFTPVLKPVETNTVKKVRKLKKPTPKPTIVTTIPDPCLPPVETMDEPLIVKEVLDIILRPKTIGDTKVWLDAVRGKVYQYLENGKRGTYLGRWNDETQSISTEAPDSDAEYKSCA